MSIPHKRPPAPARFSLVGEATQNVPAILAIIQDKESCWYYVSSLAAGWGQLALHFDKYEAESGSDPEEDSYSVLLDGCNSHCGCKGFFRWGAAKIEAAAKAGEEHPERHGCKHLGAAVWLLHERQYVPPLLGSFVDPEEPPPPPPVVDVPEPDPYEEYGDPVGSDACPCCVPESDPDADGYDPAGLPPGDCPDCGGTCLAGDGMCVTCQGWGSVQAAQWWEGRQPAPVSYLPESE